MKYLILLLTLMAPFSVKALDSGVIKEPGWLGYLLLGAFAFFSIIAVGASVIERIYSKGSYSAWTALDPAASLDLDETQLVEFRKLRKQLWDDGHKWSGDASDILAKFIYDNSTKTKATTKINNDQLDAVRYQALRQMHWDSGKIAIVQDATKLPLGTQCLSGAMLDDALDNIIKESKKRSD